MKIAGCFLIVFCVFALPAAGADLTVFGGFQDPGDITLSGTVDTVNRILDDPIDVGVFGLRVGQGRILGSEHTLAFAPNFLDSESRAFFYNSNLRIQLPMPRFRPYATVGLGTVIVSGSGLSDIGTKFAVNYGGGLKVQAVGPIGARIDVRRYTLPSVQDQTLNIVEVSLGVLFGF